MKKVFGIILLVIGGFGFIGMINKPPTMDNGFAFFIGKISPLFFLFFGFMLIKKRKEQTEE